MKSALILISSFFLIGVFGESVSVSVMEGNSLTLHTGLTAMQTSDNVEWRLKGERIAKIIRDSSGLLSVPVSPNGASGGRLQLDKQNGDLKITNFRNTDSGSYTLKIKSTRGSPEKTFNVSGVSNADKDPVKKVLGVVGESVTLKPEKNSDEVIKWKFGPQNTVPADSSTVYDHVLDGRFKDRLKLDDQTGFLTITITRTTDSGIYEAEIRGSGYTIHKTFNVTVTDEVKLVLMEGDSVPLHTGLTQIQTDVVILWRFGDQDDFIASLNSRGVDPRWSNVHLNIQTGDLTINNIQRNQSGNYKVEISTTNMISHRKYHININEGVTLVLVMEGDSVTLHTGPSKIQRDDVVLWYGDKGVRITPLTGSVDARWKNTVQNDQTGDLTIRNIRKDQSGDYNVNFSNSSSMNVHRKFHINIADVFSDETDGMKTVSVMKGDSVFLKTSVTEIQKGDLIEWLFGAQNITIAKTDGKSNSTYNDKDVRFKDRLNLDIQTGGLTIENSNIEHSGRYQLKIINKNTYTIQKSFSVTVSAVPSSGLSIAGIVFAVLVVFVATLGVIYYCCKSSKPERSREVNGQNDTSIKDEETELTKPAEAVEQR